MRISKTILHLFCLLVDSEKVKASISSSFSCSGKAPGYYADMSSSCSSYLLCLGYSLSRGMIFSCPQGTKFQQRTLVCDHAHSVNCPDSSKYFENNTKIWKKKKIDLEKKGKTEKKVAAAERKKR